ncbi:hypothetical protein U1Q18_012629 [Sarracenia purpurea var. burkii]
MHHQQVVICGIDYDTISITWQPHLAATETMDKLTQPKHSSSISRANLAGPKKLYTTKEMRHLKLQLFHIVLNASNSTNRATNTSNSSKCTTMHHSYQQTTLAAAHIGRGAQHSKNPAARPP